MLESPIHDLLPVRQALFGLCCEQNYHKQEWVFRFIQPLLLYSLLDLILRLSLHGVRHVLDVGFGIIRSVSEEIFVRPFES